MKYFNNEYIVLIKLIRLGIFNNASLLFEIFKILIILFVRVSSFWMMPNGGLLGGQKWKNFKPTGNAAKGAELDIFIGNTNSDNYGTDSKWDGYGKHMKRFV